MMRGLIYILVLFPILVTSQEDKMMVASGNKLYKEGKIDKAQDQYNLSLVVNPTNFEAAFNLANSYLKQEKLEDAQKAFESLAEQASDKKQKAKAYYNAGNIQAQQKKWPEAVKTYKQALLNDPSNANIRYNYNYAKQMLSEEQNQQQQQQDQQDKQDQKDQKDQKDQQNKKDQQQNKDQQDQNQNQDQKDQKDQKDQQQKENKENQQQEQQKKDQQQGGKGDKDKQKDQKQQPQPQKMSKEEAERMLKAYLQQNKDAQEKAKKAEKVGVGSSNDKDW